MEPAEIERLLLGDVARYDRVEAARRAGVSEELSVRLWRALGFPDVPYGEVAFTDTDVAKLAMAGRYLNSGIADPEIVIQVTRVISASMARVASAQVELGMSRLDREQLTDDERLELLVLLFQTVLPDWTDLLVYTYRRHVLAATRRTLTAATADRVTAVQTVGFADLVGFTAMSQQLDEGELAAVVGRFETTAYDTVAEHGGRIIKMIGDEVMFVTDDAAAAVRIGLTLAETFAGDDSMSDVRVGIACGTLLPREGDYFGPTVNLASRIVNVAYPGSVLVSDEVHEGLAGDESFGWKSLRPRRLKGIGSVPLWVAVSAARASRGSRRARADR
jgi:adenylate cyclase